MNFAAWQSLAPDEAAREVHRRAAALPPAQQRAIFATLAPERELAARFAAAPRHSSMGGVPALLKDLFDVAGEPTRAGSTFLPGIRPAAGDGAFASALRAAGVVLAGKTHTTEFAYGLTGENAHFGDVHHPLFPPRTSGGSSSGSAAAVAAGVVPFATGTDTGGSVRVPAAYCGLFGLRLSPFHPWIADAVPLAPCFDTAGWFTARPDDMHLALDALLPLAGGAEHGVRTSGSSYEGRGCYLELPGLDETVAKATAAAASRLAPAPPRKVAALLHHAFAKASEAYQVLGSLAAWESHRPWFDVHRDQYGSATRARLERALTWTSDDVGSARSARDKALQAWDEYFRDWDYLLLPAVPFPAPLPADFTSEGRSRILALTAPASLAGLPVLTLPVPLDKTAPSLTAGLQLVVRDAREPVLRLALRQWEQAFSAGCEA